MQERKTINECEYYGVNKLNEYQSVMLYLLYWVLMYGSIRVSREDFFKERTVHYTTFTLTTSEAAHFLSLMQETWRPQNKYRLNIIQQHEFRN